MGKSKTTIHERQLTPEERQLIEMQGKYLNSIQPSIDALVNYGTNQIQNIVTPDWQKLYNDQTAEMQQIKNEFTPLSQGILPSVFTNAKQNYFNRMYENTMGKNLASLAQKVLLIVQDLIQRQMICRRTLQHKCLKIMIIT